jgi:hypothetical protein
MAGLLWGVMVQKARFVLCRLEKAILLRGGAVHVDVLASFIH